MNSPYRKRDSDDAYVLGIDLGGTSINLGLFRKLGLSSKPGLSQRGELVSQHQIFTADVESPRDAFVVAKSFVSKSMADQSSAGQSSAGQSSADQPGSLDRLEGIGLAMPGVLVGDGAALKETSNLHKWHGVDFGHELESVFDRPVAVLNDANAAALAESAYGKHSTDSLAMLTLGTGIGGGIVIDGRPIAGKHFCGGEVGHIPIEFGEDARLCGCGRPGHLEAYAGAAGVVQTTYKFLQESGASSILASDTTSATPIEITPRDVANAAAKGDALALKVISQTGVYLGRVVAGIVHVTDPSVLLLGGAMTFGGPGTSTGEHFINAIRSEVLRLALVEIAENLRIDFATLGSEGGVYGAAHFAIQSARSSNQLGQAEEES